MRPASGSSDGSKPSGKWAARASFNPFAASSTSPPPSSNDAETTELLSAKPNEDDDDGKENRSPQTGRKWDHPNVTMTRGSHRSLHVDDLMPSGADIDSGATSTLLGKRPMPSKDASQQRRRFLDTSSEDTDAVVASATRDPLIVANVLTHFEARARELHGRSSASANDEAGQEDSTLVVNDFTRVAQLYFGSVALGERKSLKLTLENPSELGNARIKYEGYVVLRNEDASDVPQAKTRFKCDLHVCVVDALKSVTLRVTFEPLAVDVGREVTATLKFTVNDRFKLQCRATGSGTPRVALSSKFGRRRQSQASPVKNAVDTLVVAVDTRKETRRPSAKTAVAVPQSTIETVAARHTAFTISSAVLPIDRELQQEQRLAANPKVGDKRRKSLTIEFTPPRNLQKRRKSEQRASAVKTRTPRKSLSNGQESSGLQSSAKKPFVGSWWKQRQEVYDENWMAKQAEGFTKWMNYVLMDGTAQRLNGGDAESSNEDPTGRTRRRFDFSSLRVLSQKRMESGWAQAAVELYHSPSMDDILFDLQEEINNKKLLFRADRPVYADVGLQEELIRLLNNYHPVWLCLGLRAVLGHQVMKEEKCSLRSVFSATATGKTGQRKKEDQKMPRVLRRIILRHLIKDSRVARNFRLVKNLKTPLDGSTADRNDGGNAFKNTKKNINGREYFDSLTETFMLKFFMLVLFLDRAIEHKPVKFPHFPCLFRIAPTIGTTAVNAGHQGNKDDTEEELKVKNSQVLVTEFCRFFLASEGRIDKHLKQLGYVLKHEQTALDEIDLEIKSWEVDLRDGIRLAKLMEALTAPPSSSQEGAIVPQPKGLANFLRVPALSRLQKVHNVEICLHFLQDKCGSDVLASLKSSSGMGDPKPARDRRLSGRVRVSSSGFAGLRSKVDEKLVENLAKDIVNGHREKTLALLWKLISCFQLQSLVDAETMRREIANVVKRMSFRAKEFFDLQQRKAPLVHADEHECYGLLLEWCRAVCANYTVDVSDFSVSFADGKALCYLLHYYHPMLLTKADVLPTTRDLRQGGEAQQTDESTLLANEQRHFAIVNDRIKQLGEIPVLMPKQYNTKNPPEEKMVVTFVCYVQSRLMDSYSEIHAASRLKRWWMSPFIRLRMRLKKNKSARVVQRFWYTSSQKRLAIRQCRKLLRAARLVKSSVQTWTARKRFNHVKRSVVAIQRAFRSKRQQRLHGDTRSQEAARVIQHYWQEQLDWRREVEKRAQGAAQLRLVRRLEMKASCAVIEKCWLRHLSRLGARLLRQQMIVDRELAATRIQTMWRQAVAQAEAKQLRAKTWRQVHDAARVLQRCWRDFQTRREERARVVALGRFEQMMKQKEREKREVVLKQKVETRAAKRVQKGFRMFAVRKRVVAATKLASTFRGVSQKARYQQERRCAVLLQRNVRLWRRRRQLTALTRFYEMLKTFQRMQEDEAQQRDRRLRTLKNKAERRAVCRIQRAFRSFRAQKRALAATKLQSVARSWLQQRRYVAARSSVCLLQKTVRIWRRRRQLQALLMFQNMLACYQRMQQEEEERRECEREARLRRLQEKAAYRAAYRIQMVYRFHVYHKRALAATLFQVAFRGFRERQRYVETRQSAVKVQRAIRCWLARTTFRRALRLHRAAVAIQKCVRGWRSRRGRFSFYALRAQLQRLRVLAACWRLEFWFVSCTTRRRKRRALELRARWTQLRAGILRKRVADANKIACCWRAYCLRRTVLVRIQQKRQLQTAALGVQRWWMQLCWKWAECQKRAEEKRRRELEAMARAMAKKRAVRVLGTWLGRKVVTPYRQRNAHYVAVWKLQAWWRGMLVRLHQSSPEVTQQRKKLATMKLVGQEQHEAVAEAKSGPQRRKIKTQEEKQTEKQQPLTLGARLEVALHMLLHGKRLQDMLFASHTIEMCTRYSRECCGKCVQLQISSTIYAAIRGLNRSRPHVELLHQLLLVLVNLTTYRRSMNSSKAMQMQVAGDVDGRLQVDLRALDTLVDLLHIHRDMHHVFVLSARVLKYYLEALKPQVRANAAVRESWREAEKRLGGLQELLAKKLALYNATASFRSVASGKSSTSSNLMSKMNPKAAASIMTQLVMLMEAQD